MTGSRLPLILVLSVIVGMAASAVWGQGSAAVQRGAYIFRATGGCSCHTDHENHGALMAGGRPIDTPFGRVYSTNITPDPKTGIGNWSDADFLQAMTEGVGPNGAHYYPAFPYTAFTRMTKQDLLDLKAYFFSLPPVEQETKPPDLMVPLRWRPGLVVWKWLYFQPGTFEPDLSQSPEWNRGAYLATALGHCGECHTPRNLLGGLQTDMSYAGSVDGPQGELAPNITPDEATGIGAWSIPDIVWFLQTGFKPDGDDAQGLMSELIDNGFKHLTEDDLRAIAVYLQSLKPIRHKVVAPDKSTKSSSP